MSRLKLLTLGIKSHYMMFSVCRVHKMRQQPHASDWQRVFERLQAFAAQREVGEVGRKDIQAPSG